MARTILQIYDEMILEKENQIQLNALQPSMDSGQTLLNDLTSTSKVAVWRLIFFVVAVQVWTLEKLHDEHKAWINKRASELIVGTTAWYHSISLQFQYGDSLVYDTDQKVYKYAAITPANQIIKLVSVNEVGGQLLIKLAKLDGGNLPIPLASGELTAFQAYMSKMKFAGVKVASVSRVADLLTISYHIYYDPLVLSSTGELISSPGTFPVEDAINNYIKNLDFDGVFSVTQLTDQIQASSGVVNPVFESAQAKFGVNPYVVINDYYKPNAGYLQIDPAIPLNTTIDYIAYAD